MTPYDEVLYPTRAYPQTDPNRLAAIAFLRGLLSAPIERCRVLELGCGAGTNLIGMAYRLPGSEFVGFDLAHRPIVSGQKFIRELGLGNIGLHPIDLAEARADRFGSFDFIIAHGLYSWVPEKVRERILAVCREMLNSNGIAYISYNAYPGNHFRDLVRGMIRFHAARFQAPAEKIGQARGLLKFLAESQVTPDYYAEAIKTEFERVVNYPDEAFYHDDLSSINQPFYFHEFIRDAKRHGLQFVGEARASELVWEDYTPEVRGRMKELEGTNETVREQFKDFIRGWSFRQTVLCRKEIELAPDLVAERVQELYAMCDAAPLQRTELEGRAAVFRRAAGAELLVAPGPVSAAFGFLCSQWPGSASWQELREAAALGSTITAEEEAELAQTVIKAQKMGFLQLHVARHNVANRITERPLISELARLQLRQGSAATSQLHTSVDFPDPFKRRFVQLLDGTRNRRMLAREMLDFVKSERCTVFRDGTPIKDSATLETILESRLQQELESLARAGMLLSANASCRAPGSGAASASDRISQRRIGE